MPQETIVSKIKGTDDIVYTIKDSNALHGADKGVANGIAELDENGKVPSNQLPAEYSGSQVEEYDSKDFSDWDEWVASEEYSVGDLRKVTDGNTVTGYVCIKANSSSTIESDEWRTATKFPISGESEKIYIAKDTNTIHRWDGAAYILISSSGTTYQLSVTVANRNATFSLL